VTLPEGWTLERVRAVANGPADLLPAITSAWLKGYGEDQRLTPRCVISFSGLCLVLDDDGVWYMGAANADGAIVCWAGYGDDLELAIRSL
jgi:hypothetical protein